MWSIPAKMSFGLQELKFLGHQQEGFLGSGNVKADGITYYLVDTLWFELNECSVYLS